MTARAQTHTARAAPRSASVLPRPATSGPDNGSSRPETPKAKRTFNFSSIPTHDKPLSRESFAVPLAIPMSFREHYVLPRVRSVIPQLSSGTPITTLIRTPHELLRVPAEDAEVHEDRTSFITALLSGSRAVTFGRHVLIGEPVAENRDSLLVHELAHVIQQDPRNRAPASRDPEVEADRFAEFITSPKGKAPLLGSAGPQAARATIFRQTLDLPGDLLLIVDADDGDFVGGCVRQIVPHVGAKLVMKGVPKAAGNQIFDLHVGFMTNAMGERCVFFYESVTGICETLCFESQEELDRSLEQITDWLSDMLKRVFEALAIMALIIVAVLIIDAIATAIVAALALLALA